MPKGLLLDLDGTLDQATVVVTSGPSSGTTSVNPTTGEVTYTPGLDFVGGGGDLFVTFLVGYLLTIVTLGIYGAWFQVNLFKFFTSNTRAEVYGQVHAGDFSGTGGEYFVKILIGVLLTMFTFGIYGAWFMVDLMRFQLNNTSFSEAQVQGHGV